MAPVIWMIAKFFFCKKANRNGLGHHCKNPKVDIFSVCINSGYPFLCGLMPAHTRNSAAIIFPATSVSRIVGFRRRSQIARAIIRTIAINMVYFVGINSVDKLIDYSMGSVTDSGNRADEVSVFVAGKGFFSGIFRIVKFTKSGDEKVFDGSGDPEKLASLWFVFQHLLKRFLTGQLGALNSHKCSSRTFVAQAWWSSFRLHHHAVQISGFGIKNLRFSQ